MHLLRSWLIYADPLTNEQLAILKGNFLLQTFSDFR